MKSFKAMGYCHRNDPAERTLVDLFLILPHLLTFLLVQSCLLAPQKVTETAELHSPGIK